jgi:hypothetical protein
MPKLSFLDLSTLSNEQSAINTINANFALMEQALDNTVSRDGSAPNNMEASLDMDGQRILNVAEPAAALDAANKEYVDDRIAALESTDLSTLRADLAGTTNGLGIDLDGTVAGSAIDQITTGQHFTQNNARIHRFNDRILLNGATVNDGAFPNVTQDWQSQAWVTAGFGAGPMASAIFGLANNSNPNSAIGVNVAIRSRDFTSAGTTAIPVFGCAFNDNTTLGTKAYGGYFEAHRPVGSVGVDTYGVEIDTRASTSTITPDPYTIGDVVALQLASGAEWSATGQFDASAAIQIAANPMKFKKGIVIRDDAITDLGSGLKDVLCIPKGSLIRQWTGAGAPASYIYFATNTAAGSSSLQLADSSFKVSETSTGSEQFRVTVTTNAVNFLGTIAGATGTSPGLEARGADANANLRLIGKGTGGPALIDGGGATKISVGTTGIGFYGTAPAAKPAITGSRGGNAALADLLTKLAALGLITDSTTA